MRFKTHEEIDDYYRTQGVDVDKLKREEIAVGISLDKSQKDAKDFLKNKMGNIKYFFWKLFNGDGISLKTYGQQNFIIKAKQLGWKDTFQYPKGF